MRVLVTGASGFVGAHAVARLVAAGHEVIGATPDGAPVEGAKPLRIDIRDRHVLVRSLESARPDAVLHLAAIAFVPEARKNPLVAFETNANGTLNLLSACSESCPDVRVVLVSTAEVYGMVNDETAIPITERQPVAPVTIYGASKAAAEHVAAVAARDGFDVVVLRPFNHIGPGQAEDYVVSSFAHQIARMEKRDAEPVLRHGNLDAVRDFTDVRDVVDAYERAVSAPIGRLERGRPYNVCSSRGVSIASVVSALIERARCEITTEIDEDRLRPSDVPVSIGDGTRLRDAVGFTPSIEIDQTLDDILADARSRVGDV